MGFKIPEYLQQYLNTKDSAPLQFWVNNSQYYAGLAPYYIGYMNSTVRKCVAYANGIKDGGIQSSVSTNVGYAIKKTAVKLIKGDKIIFNGDDIACQFLDDIWSKKSKFNKVLEQAIDYTISGGTCAIKINTDRQGRSSIGALRVDRYYATTDDNENVIDFVGFVNILSRQKASGDSGQYWLVEHRYYKDGRPKVEYKVHTKSGTAGAEVLPVITQEGIPYKALPEEMKDVIKRMGVKVNTPITLPFSGLGVWLIKNTATNSVIPGAPLGDPMLYAADDLLFSLDTVLSGTIIDVLNGEGKILVPASFIREIKTTLEQKGVKQSDMRVEKWRDDDDTLMYISTEHDKDFPPQSVQFDIRSTAYKEMFELYLRQIVAHSGFAPTSVFPFLADNSARTATEVTAEENLTRATIQSFHSLNIPTINEALEEVLKIEGFKGRATIQLSDYIGNKIQRDANLRANYEAGALPQDTFIQKINGLNFKETNEYLEKIRAEQKEKDDLMLGGDLE